MRRRLRLLVLVAGMTSAAAFAQETPPTATTSTKSPVPPATEATPAEADAPQAVGPALSTEDLSAATKLDALSMPTPGELLAAVDKLGKPDWERVFRPPIGTNYWSRPQLALNIGGLIADGYLAVEAENAQQVKNVGKDIIALAKPLGVQQDIIDRGKSLTDFAERGEWDTLKEELEATQNEVKSAMVDRKDPDLITLVTLGGWVRGVEAMADYVGDHYTPEGARLLRQPAVVRFLTDRLTALPSKVRDDPAVKKVRGNLGPIEQAVSFPADTTPSRDAVQELARSAKELLREIAAKKK